MSDDVIQCKEECCDQVEHDQVDEIIGEALTGVGQLKIDLEIGQNVLSGDRVVVSIFHHVLVWVYPKILIG